MLLSVNILSQIINTESYQPPSAEKVKNVIIAKQQKKLTNIVTDTKVLHEFYGQFIIHILLKLFLTNHQWHFYSIVYLVTSNKAAGVKYIFTV